MTDAVLAGAAAHNAGQHGLARTIWAGESPLGPTENGRSLDALAEFATAVTESRRGDWESARDAATEAELAIAAVDDPSGSDSPIPDLSCVDLAPIRRWLTAFLADPEVAERSPPPPLAVSGEHPMLGELPLSAAALVAGAVAVARGDDPAIVADARRFARERDHPESTRYATFLRDYAGADAGQRPIVFERLSGLVERERRKEDDVEGLFD